MSFVSYVPVFPSPAGCRVATPATLPEQPEVRAEAAEKAVVVSKYRIFNPPEGHRSSAVGEYKQAHWRHIRRRLGSFRAVAAAGGGGGGEAAVFQQQQEQLRREQQTGLGSDCPPQGATAGTAAAFEAIGAASAAAAAGPPAPGGTPDDVRFGSVSCGRRDDRPRPPGSGGGARGRRERQGRRSGPRPSTPEIWESEALCGWRTPPASAHVETKDLFAVLHARRVRPPTDFTRPSSPRAAAARGPDAGGPEAGGPNAPSPGKRRSVRSSRAPAVSAGRGASPQPGGEALAPSKPPPPPPPPPPQPPPANDRPAPPSPGPPSPCLSPPQISRQKVLVDLLRGDARRPQTVVHRQAPIRPAPFERAPARDGRGSPTQGGLLPHRRGRLATKPLPRGAPASFARFSPAFCRAAGGPGHPELPAPAGCEPGFGVLGDPMIGDGGAADLELVRKRMDAARYCVRDLRGMFPPLMHRNSYGAAIPIRRSNFVKMGVTGQAPPVALSRRCFADSAAPGAAERDAESSSGGDGGCGGGYSGSECDSDEDSDSVSTTPTRYNHPLLTKHGYPVAGGAHRVREDGAPPARKHHHAHETSPIPVYQCRLTDGRASAATADAARNPTGAPRTNANPKTRLPRLVVDDAPPEGRADTPESQRGRGRGRRGQRRSRRQQPPAAAAGPPAVRGDAARSDDGRRSPPPPALLQLQLRRQGLGRRRGRRRGTRILLPAQQRRRRQHRGIMDTDPRAGDLSLSLSASLMLMRPGEFCAPPPPRAPSAAAARCKREAAAAAGGFAAISALEGRWREMLEG